MIIMRRRFKSLQERLSDEAQRLRAMANEMPTEAAKEAALKKARQTETASHTNSSPRLQPPK